MRQPAFAHIAGNKQNIEARRRLITVEPEKRDIRGFENVVQR